VIRSWSIDNLKAPPVAYRGHSGPVYLIAYSPTRNSLASGSEDHTIRLWEEHSPLFRDEANGPKPARGFTPPTPPPWVSSIDLPRDFGEVAGYASEGERAIVASRDGKLALFIIGADRRSIVNWLSPEPIHALGVEQGRIVATAVSGKRYSWPFFPDIHKLVQFADEHLPVDGDHRVKLSDAETCAVSPPEDGCPSDEQLSN
jgi:WD40 repeat protein